MFDWNTVVVEWSSELMLRSGWIGLIGFIHSWAAALHILESPILEDRGDGRVQTSRRSILIR